MKIFLLIIVLLISSGSYYGEVNEQGEKVISIQENLQTENIVIDEIVEPTQKPKEEIIKVEKIENIEETKETKVDMQFETKVEKEKKEEQQNNESTIINEEVTDKQVAHKVEQPSEPIKEETPTPQINPIVHIEEKSNPMPQCNGNNHAVGAGNSNQWFDTEEQAVALYNSEIKLWGDKWTNYEIDDETYYQNCPDGYEDWTCPICGKWTINLYY